MGNNKGRSACHQFIHTILYDLLCSRIDRTCRLIKDQYRRICNGCSSDRQKLSLPLTQVSTVTGQYRIIAIRQFVNKTVCIGKFCCCMYFLIRCIQFTVADIIRHRTGKEVGILQYDTK